MRIVINKCWGGFGLSEEAMMRYAELSGFKLYKQDDMGFTHFYKTAEMEDSDYFSDSNIARNDEILVQVVEELGEKADGRFASLKIVDIPDDIDWIIDEYDGQEIVRENSRSWG